MLLLVIDFATVLAVVLSVVFVVVSGERTHPVVTVTMLRFLDASKHNKQYFRIAGILVVVFACTRLYIDRRVSFSPNDSIAT